jgi:hypothetical protein
MNYKYSPTHTLESWVRMSVSVSSVLMLSCVGNGLAMIPVRVTIYDFEYHEITARRRTVVHIFMTYLMTISVARLYSV